jgi:tetratricopeptide (TPR) repeat protein
LPPGHPSIETGGLDDLFLQLHDARSEDDAKPIDALIQARMMRSGSATIDLLMDRALVAVQADNKALAFDILDSVIALKPDYAEGWNKRATLYFLSHDYGKAISDVEMVLRLQPRHYRALIGLAGMLNELGDKTHALAALKRVLTIYPTNSDVAKDVTDLEAAIGGQSL